MTNEEKASQTTWGEVGEQFQALGETIARALRATWEREETRQHVEELQAGLEGLVQNVGETIHKLSESVEGQRMRDEAKKAAESARAAGGKAWKDARPHILSALRQVNAELQGLTDRLEGTQGTGDAAPTEGT